MKKHYDLDKKSVEIIHEYMEKYSIKSEVNAVKFIINDYKEKDEAREKMIGDISEKIKEELKNDLTRLRLGVRTAERNSIILKDIANTFLYKENYSYLMPATGKEKHKVLIEAEKHLNEIISHAKQVKDNEKAEKGIE